MSTGGWSAIANLKPKIKNKKWRLYPASLDLGGVPVLVVGGGTVAARKVASLLGAQASVTVVAPEFDAAFKTFPTSETLVVPRASRPCDTGSRPVPHDAGSAHGGGAQLRQVRRRFRVSDLNGQVMAFATTGDLALNARIAEQAKRRGIWVNVAAPGEAGNLLIPAALWRGPVCVAVSTSGASAALARTLRELLGQTIGPEWGQLATLLEARRARILKRIAEPGARRRLLRRLAEPRWAKMIKRCGVKHVAREMDTLLNSKLQIPNSKKKDKKTKA